MKHRVTLPDNRTAARLHECFVRRYGAQLDAGLLAPNLILDLVRGVAFLLLSAQDESVDRLRILSELEAAIEEVALVATARQMRGDWVSSDDA